MILPEVESPAAKTPSRKSGTSCILRRPFSILLRDAHTTNSAAPAWSAAPTRSHSPSPWSDSDPGPDATQGRPPAPAPGQTTGGDGGRPDGAPGRAGQRGGARAAGARNGDCPGAESEGGRS